MGQQLTFDLPSVTALGRNDFFVSAANETATKGVENWQDWPGQKLLIFGPTGSGKTHLTHVWAALANARIIDARALSPDGVAEIVASTPNIAVEDIHTIAGDALRERALFHLHNLVLAEGGHLMLSGTGHPAGWPITLPDLQSRIAATQQLELHAPDDPLLKAVLVKLFADRQLSVASGVIDYLTTHMERSLDAAQLLVAALDETALTQRRPLTRNLAARVLQNMSQVQQ